MTKKEESFEELLKKGQASRDHFYWDFFLFFQKYISTFFLSKSELVLNIKKSLLHVNDVPEDLTKKIKDNLVPSDRNSAICQKIKEEILKSDSSYDIFIEDLAKKIHEMQREKIVKLFFRDET